MLQEITRATLCRRGSGGCMHFHCKSLLPRPGRGSVLSAPSHSFPLPALPFHGKENVGYFCPFGIAIDSYRRHPCFLPSLMSASALAFRHRHYYSRISSSPNRGEIQDRWILNPLSLSLSLLYHLENLGKSHTRVVNYTENSSNIGNVIRNDKAKNVALIIQHGETLRAPCVILEEQDLENPRTGKRQLVNNWCHRRVIR